MPLSSFLALQRTLLPRMALETAGKSRELASFRCSNIESPESKTAPKLINGKFIKAQLQ